MNFRRSQFACKSRPGNGTVAQVHVLTIKTTLKWNSIKQQQQQQQWPPKAETEVAAHLTHTAKAIAIKIGCLPLPDERNDDDDDSRQHTKQPAMNCGLLPRSSSYPLACLSDKLISLPAAAGAADVLCRQRNPVIMLVIIINSMSLPWRMDRTYPQMISSMDTWAEAGNGRGRGGTGIAMAGQK